MNYDLSRLGFFQFDNLVRSRVPFFLIHEGIHFSELYGPLEKMHLESRAVTVDFMAPMTEALKELQERRIPKGFPVVLLSQEGIAGQDWLTALESEGFSQVCWVVGGWKALRQEAAAL